MFLKTVDKYYWRNDKGDTLIAIAGSDTKPMFDGVIETPVIATGKKAEEIRDKYLLIKSPKEKEKGKLYVVNGGYSFSEVKSFYKDEVSILNEFIDTATFITHVANFIRGILMIEKSHAYPGQGFLGMRREYLDKIKEGETKVSLGFHCFMSDCFTLLGYNLLNDDEKERLFRAIIDYINSYLQANNIQMRFNMRNQFNQNEWGRQWYVTVSNPPAILGQTWELYYNKYINWNWLTGDKQRKLVDSGIYTLSDLIICLRNGYVNRIYGIGPKTVNKLLDVVFQHQQYNPTPQMNEQYYKQLRYDNAPRTLFIH